MPNRIGSEFYKASKLEISPDRLFQQKIALITFFQEKLWNQKSLVEKERELEIRRRFNF